MCGICGLVDFSGNVSLQEVHDMNSALAHRGPDAGGVHAYGCCVLGHRRLSIVDLSEAANQPMLSDDGKVALVFNGEIYNFLELRREIESRGYTFKTGSDTEVILALYLEQGAERLVERLNGMFAFAVWDDRIQRLLLARDRLGKKPLYYYRSETGIYFSSELGSLLKCGCVPRNMSNQALFEFLMYDFIPSPHTIFEKVYKLPAGNTAELDRDGLRVRKYWDLPDPVPQAASHDESEKLISLLSDAVQRRLIADVPLGSFLSGGIDSSLVTALMARASTDKIKTFSISFPGTSHDESKWARLAAEHIGAEHHEHPVEYDLREVFPSLARHFGEPFGDSSALPTWHLCAHTRKSVTVALSGDGGDELFGGYERYLARRLQILYELMPGVIRDKIVEPIIDRMPASTDYYGTSLSKKLKLFVAASRRVRENPLALIPRTFTYEEALRLTGIDYHMESDPVIGAARQWMGLDPVSRMMFTDIRTYMAEDILTKVDRMSMAHALEVRSPLLDYRIVEFACRLPLSLKIRRMVTKFILKQAAKPVRSGSNSWPLQIRIPDPLGWLAQEGA